MGRNSKASIRRNAEAQAPIAKPMDKTAASDVALFFFNCRHAKTTSPRNESSQGTIRKSRLASRSRKGRPN
jgi:hypothetical protein